MGSWAKSRPCTHRGAPGPPGSRSPAPDTAPTPLVVVRSSTVRRCPVMRHATPAVRARDRAHREADRCSRSGLERGGIDIEVTATPRPSGCAMSQDVEVTRSSCGRAGCSAVPSRVHRRRRQARSENSLIGVCVSIAASLTPRVRRPARQPARRRAARIGVHPSAVAPSTTRSRSTETAGRPVEVRVRSPVAASPIVPPIASAMPCGAAGMAINAATTDAAVAAPPTRIRSSCRSVGVAVRGAACRGPLRVPGRSATLSGSRARGGGLCGSTARSATAQTAGS